MDVDLRRIGGYSRYVGRVGALAVALGVGFAVASTQGTGVASAETGTSSSDSPSDSAGDSAESNTSTKADDGSADDDADDAEDAEDADDADDADDAEDETDEDAPDEDDEAEGVKESDTEAVAESSPAESSTDDERPSGAESEESQSDDAVDSEPASTVSEAAAPVEQAEDSVTTLLEPLAVPLAVPSAPVAPAQAPNPLSLFLGFFRDIQRTFFNRAPDARSQLVIVVLDKPEDVSDPFALLASDPDLDALAFSLLSGRGPQHGTVTFDQATKTFTYNPDDAFAKTGGTDTFTYKVSDASSGWHLPGLVSFLTKPDFGHADIATVTISLAPALKSGIDLSNIDGSVRPQDDPFGWLLGRWLDTHEIPADRGRDGLIFELSDQVSQQIRDLVSALSQGSEAPGTDAQRIGDMFASFMDTDTIAAVGLAPLLEELSGINDAADADALTTVLGKLINVNGGAYVYVSNDAKDSSRSLLHFYQGGLGLPDESYYRDPQYADILSAYPEHIAKMFALVYGGSAGDYAATAQRIVALESKLASAHWDLVKSRDPDLTYNVRSLADLSAEAPGFDWGSWLSAQGVPLEHTDEMIVGQPDYLTAFAHTWTTQSLQDWKDWAQWQTIHARAFVLTDDLVAEDFAFFGQKLSGTEQNSDRWQRALKAVDDILGYAVGKLYVEEHFSQEAKQRMEEMVDNLIEAYRESISELDWMTPETRIKALEKLDKITVKVGYPDVWPDYSALDIVRGDLYGNHVRGIAALVQRDFAKLGQPVDRTAWDMTPQTVNAYYSPTMNEIVFPAAHLQAPFFDLEADLAASYGGIGATIGHEIGHAFDDQGSQYDGDGNLVDWWTAADRAAFEARSAVLVEQFNQYVPRQLTDGQHVNGQLTLGENIADLGGLAIALKAYEKSLNGESAPIIDGYDGVQRVLLGYVQSWQIKTRDAEMIRRLATDPHAPPEFRVNGILRNLDAFYDAFGVTESDAMYLPPDERVRIWF